MKKKKNYYLKSTKNYNMNQKILHYEHPIYVFL